MGATVENQELLNSFPFTYVVKFWYNVAMWGTGQSEMD